MNHPPPVTSTRIADWRWYLCGPCQPRTPADRVNSPALQYRGQFDVQARSARERRSSADSDEPATDPNGVTTGLMAREGQRKPAYYAHRRSQ